MTTGWVASLVECVICGHVWAAVRPTEADQLECPACGYHGHIVDHGNTLPPTDHHA